MDPALISEIVAKNEPDIEAISAAVGGVPVIVKLIPHFVAIWKTAQAYQQAQQQKQG